MIQVPRGTSQTISALFLDGETPVDVVSATLGVVASDGTVIVEPATSASLSLDVWTYVLPPVADCDRLTATWAGLDADSNEWATVQTVEVVGGFYFPLSDLARLPDVSDNPDFTGQLGLARQWVESKIERCCGGTSFVERFYEETHPNKRRIVLNRDYPRRLLSVSVDGVDQILEDLHLRGDVIVSRGAWPTCWSTATVRYVAGYATEPDEELRIAALTAARHRLLSVDGASGIPDRALSMTNQFGNIRMSTADDDDHPTGIPDVDSVICGWRNKVRIPAIA